MKISLTRVIALLIFCPFILFTQEQVNISFGETLPLESGELNANFTFIENGKTIQVQGDKIRDYVFRYPGLYRIEVKKRAHKHSNDTDECTELKLPNQFLVWVDSVKMRFNASSLNLSSQIYRNISTAGIIAAIEVELENYYGHPIQMNDGIVYTAGIGSKITAHLDPKFKALHPGRHTIQYLLNGICIESSYIQFDFLEHNGNIAPIGLKTLIRE